MKTEIETAIKLLLADLKKSMKSEDALRLTQSALNLAHVAATFDNMQAK